MPAGKTVEAIVDNYATHKHPKVRARLKRHPHWTLEGVAGDGAIQHDEWRDNAVPARP